jgi:hypothetical protein
MAKQKAPNARRVIAFVETLHATSHASYVEAARQLRLVLIMALQLVSFCDAMIFKKTKL